MILTEIASPERDAGCAVLQQRVLGVDAEGHLEVPLANLGIGKSKQSIVPVKALSSPGASDEPPNAPDSAPWASGPTFSILKTSYNHARSPSETLNSARRLGYPHVEHVVVDDGKHGQGRLT